MIQWRMENMWAEVVKAWNKWKRHATVIERIWRGIEVWSGAKKVMLVWVRPEEVERVVTERRDRGIQVCPVYHGAVP